MVMEEDYRAYLLRFRRREGSASWLASLENAHTGEVLRFATERDLIVYLYQILSQSLISPTTKPIHHKEPKANNQPLSEI